jgi:hypothetical protein
MVKPILVVSMFILLALVLTMRRIRLLAAKNNAKARRVRAN